MNKPTKEALLYTRVSHEEQVKYGYSLDAQLEALKAYCLAQNLHVRAVFSDEGISGGTIEKRPQFKAMIEMAQSGDIILFTKLDRFSRNLIDANNVVMELDKKNVTIKAIQEDDIDTTSADGRFIFNLKLSLAQREREKTSERIREVFKHKNAIGEVTSGKVPFGYKIENKRLVFDEPKAEMARFIFETFDTTNDISETLRRFTSKYGKKRTYPTLRAMLTNEKYKGCYGSNSAYCEPLIAPEVFDRVQWRLLQNLKTTPTHEKYIFSRLIVCPLCGAKLFAFTSTSTAGNVYHYYKCANNQPYIDNRCTFKTIREDKVESELLDKVAIFADETKYKFVKSGDKDVSTDIKALRAKIKRLKELYIDGDIDKSTYSLKLSRFKSELSQLEQTQAQSKTALINEFQALNVREIYERLNARNKSIFWHKYIKRIMISPDKHVVSVEFLTD